MADNNPTPEPETDQIRDTMRGQGHRISHQSVANIVQRSSFMPAATGRQLVAEATE